MEKKYLLYHGREVEEIYAAADNEAIWQAKRFMDERYDDWSARSFELEKVVSEMIYYGGYGYEED